MRLSRQGSKLAFKRLVNIAKPRPVEGVRASSCSIFVTVMLNFEACAHLMATIFATVTLQHILLFILNLAQR